VGCDSQFDDLYECGPSHDKSPLSTDEWEFIRKYRAEKAESERKQRRARRHQQLEQQIVALQKELEELRSEQDQ